MKGLPFKLLKNETFKRIPDFGGKYWMSSHGRTMLHSANTRLIKAIVRTVPDTLGRPKKTTAQVELRYEGTRYTLSLARMVYFLFVKKFDLSNHSLVIYYRDGNHANCRADNLVLTTRAQMLIEAYQNPERKNNFRAQAKPVNQYSSDGLFLASYPSAVHAGLATGIHKHTINVAAQRASRNPRVFHWRYGKPRTRIIVNKK